MRNRSKRNKHRKSKDKFIFTSDLNCLNRMQIMIFASEFLFLDLDPMTPSFIIEILVLG